MARIKILIVDDDVDTRLMMSTYLNEDGKYEIITAKNGKDAIQIVLSDDPPDLIIMDFIMPNLNGLETAKVIHKNPKSANLPIILTTGFKHEYIDTEIKKGKNISFLKKPIKYNDLETKINELININS